MQVNKAVFVSGGKCFLLSLCLLIGVAVKAQAAGGSSAVWDQANKQYALKQYDSAVAGYETLLKTQPGNAMLHYNTGNAYYRLNRMGFAILHYEKAARLQPGNRQIRENLDLARSRIQDNITEASPIFFVSWWNTLHRAVGPDTWAVAALILFLVTLALVYFARTRKAAFANSGRWVSLAMVCLLITGSLAWISYQERVHPGKVVVIGNNSPFLQDPQADSKVIGNLPEGLVMDILGKEGGYYKVELQNGKAGWVPEEVLGVV